MGARRNAWVTGGPTFFLSFMTTRAMIEPMASCFAEQRLLFGVGAVRFVLDSGAATVPATGPPPAP